MPSSLGPGIPLEKVLRTLKKKIAGDGTDHLMTLSSLLGLICAMIYLGQQFFGNPMTCVAKYDRAYVDSFCYINSFFHVPRDQHSIKLGSRDEYWKIHYFQFLALVFFVQSIVLYSPSYYWKKTYKKANIKLGNIIRLAAEVRDSSDKETNDKKIVMMGRDIKDEFDKKKLICEKQKKTASLWEIFSNSLVLNFIFMKFANAILLMYFVSDVASYLSNTDFWWSGRRFINLINGEPWENSERFPRMAYCDFYLRDMANVKNATAQCVLGMNFVSEKLFFVEWLWFMLMLTLVSCNLIKFIIIVTRRKMMIGNWLYFHIRHMERKNKSNLKEDYSNWIMIFTNDIGWDGWLAIYLVESAAGPKVAAQLAAHLFDQITEDYEKDGIPKSRKPKVKETSFIKSGASDAENALPVKNPLGMNMA